MEIKEGNDKVGVISERWNQAVRDWPEMENIRRVLVNRFGVAVLRGGMADVLVDPGLAGLWATDSDWLCREVTDGFSGDMVVKKIKGETYTQVEFLVMREVDGRSVEVEIGSVADLGLTAELYRRFDKALGLEGETDDIAYLSERGLLDSANVLVCASEGWKAVRIRRKGLVESARMSHYWTGNNLNDLAKADLGLASEYAREWMAGVGRLIYHGIIPGNIIDVSVLGLDFGGIVGKINEWEEKGLDIQMAKSTLAKRLTKCMLINPSETLKLIWEGGLMDMYSPLLREYMRSKPQLLEQIMNKMRVWQGEDNKCPNLWFDVVINNLVLDDDNKRQIKHELQENWLIGKAESAQIMPLGGFWLPEPIQFESSLAPIPSF